MTCRFGAATLSMTFSAALTVGLLCTPARAAGPDLDPRSHAEALVAGLGDKIVAGQHKDEVLRGLDEAMRLYQQAGDSAGVATCFVLQGMAHTGAGDADRGLAAFEEALDLFEGSGDRFAAWTVLWILAGAEKLEGRLEPARTHLERALGLLREIESSPEPISLAAMQQIAHAFGAPALPDVGFVPKPFLVRFAEVTTRGELGGVLVELGRLEPAEAQLQKAQELGSLFGGMFDSSIQAYFGDLRRRQWRFDEARKHYEAALAGVAIGQNLPFVHDARLEVRALDRLAEIEILGGDLAKALGWNDRALALVRQGKDRQREAAVLQDRAQLLQWGGESSRAEATAEAALVIAREIDDRYRQANLLSDLGLWAMLRGDYQPAARHLEQSVALLQILDEPYLEASTRVLLAETYMLLEARGPSDGTLDRAAQLARQSSFELAEGMTELLTAWNRREAGEGDLGAIEQRYRAFWALAQAEGPIAGLENLGLMGDLIHWSGAEVSESTPPNLATLSEASGLLQVPILARGLLGKLAFQRGDFATARTNWAQARDDAEKLGHKDLIALMSSALGVALWREGNPQEAIAQLTHAVELLDQAATDLQVEELLTSYLGSERRWFYEILIETLVQQGRPEQAFEIAERARARSLLQLLGNRRLRPGQGGEPGLAAETESLRAAIAGWSRQAATCPSPECRHALEEDLRQARRRYSQLLVRLKVTNPEYVSLVTVEPLSIEEIRRDLPADTTLISYFVAGPRVHAWVLDGQSFHHVTLPLDRADLDRTRDWARNLGRSRGVTPLPTTGASDWGAELFGKLIAPLQPHLRLPRLLLIPHGALHYIPFAALRGPDGRYLIEDYTLLYAPSASALHFLRGKESPFTGTALVLGAPATLDPWLEPLPAAAREAAAVARLFDQEPLLGRQATEALLDAIGGVDLLHLAAHGLLDAENPSFSHLALAPGDGQDGNLELHEIFGRLDLSGVNLVVLSACRTAVGERSGGDEVASLTRAFLYAGSPGVIATLWSIDDDASEVLMEELYCGLRDGLPVAEALRQAQLRLLHSRDFGAPFYWAAFSLTGNPQARWRAAAPPASGH